MPDPRRLTLILNGKASGDERVRDAIAAIRDIGHRIDVKVTEGPGDAERFAAEAARDDEAGILVAGGGDGTLNAVVRGALSGEGEPACSFALLPLGTANDFARNAGIPLDPLSALEVALDVPARPIDVAVAGIDDDDPRHFVNMATAGFGPRVTAEADPDLKARLGGAAYLLSALGRIGEVTPWEGTVTGPDFAWRGSFAALAIGNGRRAGGGVELCPLAELDDGALDVTIIEAPDGDVLAGLIASLPMAVGLEPESVVRTRAASFEIETQAPVPISLDGEMLEARSLRLSVEPKAIRFHLP
ncbi:lipid kinase YegS [Breoghania corrubedonensis]|uniref:Lipid kinase YegS n=1 Tax=Breoghania corrubedonensis TaxID=665038 RepID=A0A2T5V6M6_9HYPH|nr:lipid kinase YegS [Breoghania corrubedonensis]PTW59408.1 lipid kinase YegS [Breoghania corrubedonensis]